MSDNATTPGTVRLHRVLRAPPSRVYRAFLDPDAMVKWLPPHGFTGKVHAMDARGGGGYTMSFTNFGTGSSHSFGGTYVELVENERLRYTDQFDNPGLPGQMQVTVALKKSVVGTELNDAGRHSRRDSGRFLLPGLAGIAGDAGKAGGAGDTGRGVNRLRTTLASDGG